jgi:hypothetical protein
MLPRHMRDLRSQPEEDLANGRQFHRQGGGKIQHLLQGLPLLSRSTHIYSFPPS